ncbi:MAG: hypothetical protein F4148_06580 [Caldilineaceae bacterium SB0675_bin_29]|uniref:Uncharacterized protein n=1 Tax=Caldilineaceae bacterium SB0675_bin_29 TaxID=2605266 RepID=A0A6B1FZF6_9CHLR|nr:hypothetical protein [Caldilineaceae bacterium SB0675_bin_29]
MNVRKYRLEEGDDAPVVRITAGQSELLQGSLTVDMLAGTADTLILLLELDEAQHLWGILGDALSAPVEDLAERMANA